MRNEATETRAWPKGDPSTAVTEDAINPPAKVYRLCFDTEAVKSLLSNGGRKRPRFYLMIITLGFLATALIAKYAI